MEPTKSKRHPLNVPAHPPVAKVWHFGMGVIAAFFGSFVLWSLLVTIDSAAIAPGKITVDSNRKTIQHLEGGIVKKIFVRDGSMVNQGDLLIQLDDTQPRASLDLLQGQATEMLAAEARLKAERDDLTELEFPKRLMDQIQNPKVAKILASQKRIFAANKKSFDGQVVILNQRIEQLNKEIQSLESQVESETKQLSLIQEEIEAVAYLEKQKLIEKPRLLALQREAARLLGDRGEHLGAIAKANEKIGETHSQIITTKDNYQKETLDKLQETQSRLADILEREKAAQDILNRIDIVAPQTGRVVGLKYHTIGGVIHAGEEVLNIIPSDDKLIVEARINPLDIDVVHEGLTAKVTLTAFKQRTMPTLDGVVVDVSADIFEDKQNNAAYYMARIEIPAEQLATINDIKLYPGMPTQVMIIVSQRSPFAYFMQPLTDSFYRAFREQ